MRDYKGWYNHGWTVMPFKKHLVGLDDWTFIERTSPDILINRFEEKYGVEPEAWGLLGGRQIEGSKDYSIIIDCDSDEAFGITSEELPPTRIHRGSKGGHLIFRTDRAIKSFSFNQGKNRIVEILSTGRMGVLPPSPHRKTNRPYRIIHDIAPAYIPIEKLRQGISRVATKQEWNIPKSKAETSSGGTGPQTKIYPIRPDDDLFERAKRSKTLFDYGLRPGLQSCPLPGHKNSDRNPSLSVSNNGRFFNCFSVHGGGDVTRFVQLRNNLSPQKAAQSILGEFG